VSEQLLEFSDFVAAGLPLIKARDSHSWALGDLAVDFDIKLGRPDDPDAPTLGDLAREWNVSSQRVSEWRNVSAFYPTDARTFDTTWEIYNMARRASNNSLDNALELLDKAVSQAMTVASFRRYLKGIYFEGPIPTDQLPLRLHGLVPSGVTEVWAVFKHKDGDE
jgi:hypothetical protein